ncbi:hypothetical protein GCM10011529_09140 [Polymorphobacter glacialis]|uniref:DUF5330 domain-containing protein n=1 Tax=Sandarakinorhabdus glacialis TaxID=1614636 RepID=A0A916ZNZ2_9SPHN|nr:hypothetical protein [Polymorphobacter glacialis]GGE04946.1 hypothetical protein GCM10011529_09140 [Polymorphobacter glacialis]
MTKRFFLVPALALIGAFSSPALAASSCDTAPAQIRQLAAVAQPDQARKALTLVNVGEKLCEAGGRGEASKKFSAAAKVLGTDMAALNTAPTAQ